MLDSRSFFAVQPKCAYDTDCGLSPATWVVNGYPCCNQRSCHRSILLVGYCTPYACTIHELAKPLSYQLYTLATYFASAAEPGGFLVDAGQGSMIVDFRVSIPQPENPVLFRDLKVGEMDTDYSYC